MKTIPQALVVDDEPQICRYITEALSLDGWSVETAATAAEAEKLLAKNNFLLIFCDVMLGDESGYGILRRFKEQSSSSAKFVMITGQGSAAGALDAISSGAYEYLMKPCAVDEIQKIARNVLEQHRLNLQSGNNQAPNSPAYISELPLIGKSPNFVECLKLVGRVAAADLPVLITGESGTGKEVVAHAIHLRSDRADQPFIAVNCGALPSELIESELFGHARGAFTGATADRRGLWEEAEGGTIFLDEITEISHSFQVKLLRALQENEIRRVGTNQLIKTNVRVLAATNRNIAEEIDSARFRQDLMYRLNAVTIHLPPLRERREDITELIAYFANRGARIKKRRDKVKFSPAVLEILHSYHWRGNIRELENVVLHTISLCDRIAYPEHLPSYLQRTDEIHFLRDGENNRTAQSDGGGNIRREWLSLAEMQLKYARRVLAEMDGNKQATARALNIDRKTLLRILDRADN